MEFHPGPAARAAGYRVTSYQAIGSTNEEALAAARAGDPGAHWFVTDEQTAGRGRRGRAWVAPRGNLAATLLAVVDHQPQVAATLGFVGGLALDEALRAVAPDLSVRMALDGAEGEGAEVRDRLRLKWPNDVLLDGGKLAGIGLEAAALPNGKLAVAIGIGVNVVAAPQGLPYPATSLEMLGLGLDAGTVFEALSDAAAGLMRMWNGGAGFPVLRRLWLERAAGLGEKVAVRSGEEVLQGAFETIDDQGRLVVRAADGGIRTIAAGEVHFGAVATVRA